MPQPIGWSVPIEVPVQGPAGPTLVTVDLSFTADSWAKADVIVAGLMSQGYKVRTFTPKAQAPFGAAPGGYPPRNGYAPRPAYPPAYPPAFPPRY